MFNELFPEEFPTVSPKLQALKDHLTSKGIMVTTQIVATFLENISQQEKDLLQLDEGLITAIKETIDALGTICCMLSH